MQPLEQAKHPVTVLAGRYGHPLHPALVAIPIGAWIASLAFDIGSRVAHVPQPWAQGSRWLIGLGVLGALAAAMVGFLDLFAIPAGTRVFRIALVHMTVNLAATGAYAAGFVLRAGDPAGPVGWGRLSLSVAALAALSVGGYLGGELAYRYGVRVAGETTQAEGYQPATTRPSGPADSVAKEKV